ncbi:amidohydrolase family protein [Synergistes jonesii]|uniref:amidohydrolase family protein n=1 Tax=Synergistes jonesii TaxID=2754 RepID=UPI002A763554|nr:amidohydrolase family protein [Synergistes jonesii]MDY2983927.1 amidohydrolase family protein [Synergistes jonesii]
MKIFKNATVVTGDGKTVLEKANVIEADGLVADVNLYYDENIESYAEEVVDCTGKCVMPGMINHHQHGVTFGTMFASGCVNYGREFILDHLDRSLLQGHTTVLNVDGFATMDEVEETQKCHPIRIKTATTHAPINYHAGELCDGKGFQPKHKAMTVEKMLADGAVCIGEVGGGHTLGGGGQDYLYIPRAVKEAKGKDIDYLQARAMKLSVLGRYIEESYYDRDRVAAALKEAKLDSFLTPEETRDIVYKTTLASVKVALDGYREAAGLAKRYNVPLMIHNAPTSKYIVHEIAKMGLSTLICCHSNYLFTTEECVENGRYLKQFPGVVLDAAVHDPWGAKHLVSGPENLYAFYENDLVDIISTDFAAGHSDSMLEAIQHAALEKKLVDLAKAVRQGTSRVTEVLPLLAPNLGLLKKGYSADIVVTEYPQLKNVERVYIDGKLVAKDGKVFR